MRFPSAVASDGLSSAHGNVDTHARRQAQHCNHPSPVTVANSPANDEGHGRRRRPAAILGRWQVLRMAFPQVAGCAQTACGENLRAVGTGRTRDCE
jgi:hypothetical protein